MAVCGGEGVELAHEPAREREADEAEHEGGEREAEERPLPPETREVVERDRHAELALASRDHAERAQGHGRVRDQVVEQCLPAQL